MSAAEPIVGAAPPFSREEILTGARLNNLDRERAEREPEFFRQLEARHLGYERSRAAGRAFFVQGEPTDDDLDFALWADAAGHLKQENSPGFIASALDYGSSVLAGTVEVFSEAYRYRRAMRFGTDEEKQDAEARSDALATSLTNDLWSMYRQFASGGQRLGEKVLIKTVAPMLYYHRQDPAFLAQVERADQRSWYRQHQRLQEIAADAQRVSDAAADIAIRSGWSRSGLEVATATASAAADPAQVAMSGAGYIGGRWMARGGAAASRTAALGTADMLRAEVRAGVQEVAQLERTLNHLNQLPGEEAAVTRGILVHDLAQLQRRQVEQAARLAALDAENLRHLEAAGRPSAPARAVVGAAMEAAPHMERAGEWLTSLNRGIVDDVARDLGFGGGAPRLLRATAPTALLGGALGAATGALAGDEDDWATGALGGLLLGGAAPSLLQQGGRLTRLLGENYLIGRTRESYFARLVQDARATAMDQAVFRNLDTFGPAWDFFGNVGQASAKAAATGAVLGYVAAGGEESDLATAAGTAVGGHYAPWALVSTLKGFWNPVRSPGELEGMRAANRRALRRTWAGTENLKRFDALSPTQQLDLAMIVGSNPDVVFRLIGPDDAQITADLRQIGEAPAETSGPNSRPLAPAAADIGDSRTAVKAASVESTGTPSTAPRLPGAAAITAADFAQLPGIYYRDPATGRAVIAVNPAAPQPFAPVLAHEFGHEALAGGSAPEIVRELLGDPATDTPGLFTRRDAAGQPLRRADGRYETTPEFAKAKAEYERRLAAHGAPVELSEAEFALEHAAEQGADFFLSPRADAVLRPTVGALMGRLVPHALRAVLGQFGIPFKADATVRGSLELGLRPSPAVERMLARYLRDRKAGRNRSAEREPVIDLPREQALQHADLAAALAETSAVNIDPRTREIAGTTLDAAGRRVVVDAAQAFKSPEEIAHAQARLGRRVFAAVKQARDTAADPHAVKLTPQGDAGADAAIEAGAPADVRAAAGARAGVETGAGASAESTDVIARGRYLSPETMAALSREGVLPAREQRLLRDLNDRLQSGAGERVRLLHFPPAETAAQGSRVRAQWSEEIPYGLEVSPEGGVALRTLLPDRATARLQSAWASDSRRARTLWSSPVSMVAEGLNYLRDLSTGSNRVEGLAPAKREFFHDTFGVAKPAGDSDPLSTRAAAGEKSSVFATRRLDHIGRLTGRRDGRAFKATPGGPPWNHLEGYHGLEPLRYSVREGYVIPNGADKLKVNAFFENRHRNPPLARTILKEIWSKSDIRRMTPHAKDFPRGFKDQVQFSQAMNELGEALRRSRVTDGDAALGADLQAAGATRRPAWCRRSRGCAGRD